MLPSEDPSRPKTRLQFSMRSLAICTALVAWILAVNRGLGAPYGWLTAIPLSFAVPGWLLTHGRALLGSGIGCVALCVIGEMFIIQWHTSDPKYLKSLVTLGAYGAAMGGSAHLILLGWRMVGCLLFAVSIIVFVIVVNN